MSKLKLCFLIICFAFITLSLVGCGTEDTIDHVPLELHDGQGNVIYYGMDRREAEALLGSGEPFMLGLYAYEVGVHIAYRNERVVMVGAQAAGWRTASGVEIGVTTADQLQEIYAPYLYRIFGYELHLDEHLTPLPHQEEDEEWAWAYIFGFYTVWDHENDHYVVSGLSFGDRDGAIHGW
ncbi:MAG: hypothetical protein FWD99_09125 [Oscillospiraceae bacterium]|nr:hypothetical protein [Oscillospiraceae bacterium]